FEALRIFEAINFGFSVGKSLILLNDGVIFKKVHIRNFTRRNLRDIVARLAGAKGKAKRVISDISDCEIVIHEGDVGIIGEFMNVENVSTAIVSLIKGAKHSNVYHYLERMNVAKRGQIFD
ncbi:MAG: hypothetical protein AABY10_03430, partial [Nanoarchaeota archaeon]